MGKKQTNKSWNALYKVSSLGTNHPFSFVLQLINFMVMAMVMMERVVEEEEVKKISCAFSGDLWLRQPAEPR